MKWGVIIGQPKNKFMRNQHPDIGKFKTVADNVFLSINGPYPSYNEYKIAASTPLLFDTREEARVHAAFYKRRNNQWNYHAAKYIEGVSKIQL